MYTETLNDAKAIIARASKQDVGTIKNFLLEKDSAPTLFTACGGSFSSAKYAALLYSASKGMGQAVTPLTLSSVSDEVLKQCKLLIISNSGKGVDIKYARNRMMKLNPSGITAITSISEDNETITKFEEKGIKYLAYEPLIKRNSFIETDGAFFNFALLYKIFTNDEDIASKLEFSTDAKDCFSYSSLRDNRDIKGLKDIRHFLVLYSGWGEPAAFDFESKMNESGYASVEVCDYRNFMHGRFMFVSNHMDDTAIVMLKTPRDCDFAHKIACKSIYGKYMFPANIQVITIETEHESALASIDLLFKSSVLFGKIGELAGYDPCCPKNPGRIEKVGPRGIGFTGLTREHGLKIKED